MDDTRHRAYNPSELDMSVMEDLMLDTYRVNPEDLRRTCDLNVLAVRSTAELPELSEIVGQERATRAIEFGIGIRLYGYNIYVMGPPGAGKTSTVMEYLRRRAEAEKRPSDWCYVYNFAVPYRPNALQLPAGRGRSLQRAMDELIRSLRQELPRAYEGNLYQEHISQLHQELDQRRAERFRALEAFAEEQGYAIVRTPAGLAFAPYLQGKVIDPEQYEQLDEATKQALEQRRPALQAEFDRALREIRDIERDAKQRLENLDREIATNTITPLIEPIRNENADCREVLEYLDQVRTDIIENAEHFKGEPEGAPRPPTSFPGGRETIYDRYRVNLLVDNSALKGAPIVFEAHPIFYNLMGRIEHRAEFGGLVTDHTMIRAGSLHMANGGYLVVDVIALLQDPSAWEALKRSLRQREIRIESIRQDFMPIATTGLTPEPIPLDVKVVLVGNPLPYYLLYELDNDFQKLFKVRADFGQDMDWNEENTVSYARFIGARCKEENLPHFDVEAIGKVIEYGSRLAEDRNKLSTRFAHITDIIREAAYWAQQAGHQTVAAADVQQAISERAYRSKLVEDRIHEAIAAGTIVIDTVGSVVGQVNGLSIIGLGDYIFGKPSRITARAYMGKTGVVNIEREAKLSGPIHDKGVLILTGYLGAKYALDQPLTLSATIAFEQSYEGVEGDSAASTELYALLSALAEVPIKQNIAVTGSVDQRGEVQPVGGVTSKIEGFFDTCSILGLTGEQGVIIPKRNLRHLMLREDVVETVRQGKFHVWAVDTIDEGIEILTGVEAGTPDPSGQYPEGSIHRRVHDKLKRFAENLASLELAAKHSNNQVGDGASLT